jgi:chromosome segregation ATPase
MLLGHKIGLASAYYRPTEDEILTEYEKAIDNLTIDPANRLRKKVEKLSEKQDEISLMKIKYEKEMKQMREQMESKFNQIFEKIDVKRLG